MFWLLFAIEITVTEDNNAYNDVRHGNYIIQRDEAAYVNSIWQTFLNSFLKLWDVWPLKQGSVWGVCREQLGELFSGFTIQSGVYDPELLVFNSLLNWQIVWVFGDSELAVCRWSSQPQWLSQLRPVSWALTLTARAILGWFWAN